LRLLKSALGGLLIHHLVCDEEAFIRVSGPSKYWFAGAN
jgi:hypothetical protein